MRGCYSFALVLAKILVTKVDLLCSGVLSASAFSTQVLCIDGMLSSRGLIGGVARRVFAAGLLGAPKRGVVLEPKREPTPDSPHKLKVTLIPGDGVGPELIYAVEDIVQNTGIPLDFEEVFLSEIHYTRSQSIEEAVSSIAKNNNVALKGVIQESGLGSTKSELQGMNMRLKRELDLFANVVHIRTFEGIKTRHKKKLDFVIVREQTEGEYSSLEHELVPGVIECLKIMTRKKCDRIAKQIANPTAMILCCANMLSHLHLKEYGHALRRAVEKVIAEGKIRTRDLGGYASTSDFAYAVIENFQM
ncbi:putative isocitrate dehydrogenase [NAD] subunit beta, mitochondrial [Toxocara canis]|uniref:Putative isocitrate dehydrogenase [NAD] subunit beta, mitochondrial n=1 Tax=Toxocara canis TaxID=6265 RepID=A0A0B2UYL8_TOXCA|nr:putative isocitrate dehydrogenase [NAD] subunit beta, mitochondrial [Toxocara canis]